MLATSIDAPSSASRRRQRRRAAHAYFRPRNPGTGRLEQLEVGVDLPATSQIHEGAPALAGCMHPLGDGSPVSYPPACEGRVAHVDLRSRPSLGAPIGYDDVSVSLEAIANNTRGVPGDFALGSSVRIPVHDCSQQRGKASHWLRKESKKRLLRRGPEKQKGLAHDHDRPCFVFGSRPWGR